MSNDMKVELTITARQDAIEFFATTFSERPWRQEDYNRHLAEVLRQVTDAYIEGHYHLIDPAEERLRSAEFSAGSTLTMESLAFEQTVRRIAKEELDKVTDEYFKQRRAFESQPGPQPELEDLLPPDKHADEPVVEIVCRDCAILATNGEWVREDSPPLIPANAMVTEILFYGEWTCHYCGSLTVKAYYLEHFPSELERKKHHG